MPEGSNQVTPSEVKLAQLIQLAQNIQGRTIALFLADQTQYDALKGTLEETEQDLGTLRKRLIEPYECPPGTVRCPWGCCVITRDRH
jgi:hypothetical protein